MRGRVEEEVVRWLFGLRPVVEDEVVKPLVAAPKRRATPLTLNHPAADSIPAFAAARSRPIEADLGPEAPQPARVGGDDAVKTVRREEPKVGRNDPCPCGSGKKYKKCHGMAA
jgi:preprotein translocase subunit SecA